MDAFFSCLNMRATHIEVTESLDTDSSINSQRKFVSRRGCPRIIRSDNQLIRRRKRDSSGHWHLEPAEDRNVFTTKGHPMEFQPSGASHMGRIGSE